jgi:hypothetical protein
MFLAVLNALLRERKALGSCTERAKFALEALVGRCCVHGRVDRDRFWQLRKAISQEPIQYRRDSDWDDERTHNPVSSEEHFGLL